MVSDGVVSDDDLEINFEDVFYQLDSIYSMVVELKSSSIGIFFTHKKAKDLVAKDEEVPHLEQAYNCIANFVAPMSDAQEQLRVRMKKLDSVRMGSREPDPRTGLVSSRG